MDLEHLREYVTLAETLSFTRAAKACFVSQSALSRHVAAMEEELGVQLVARSTHHVEVTPAGRVAYECFKPLVERYDQGLRRLANWESEVTGSLVISSPYYFTEKYTEPIVRHFTQVSPRCEVSVISCQHFEGMDQMRSGTSDLVVNMGTRDHLEGVAALPFATEPLGVLMDATGPLASRTSVTLAELDPATIIVVERSDFWGSGNETDAAGAISRLRGHEVRVVEVEQVDMIPLAIQQTGGISILPYECRHMDRSYVRMVRLDEKGLSIPMCLYWREDNKNPMLPAFLDAAREVFPPVQGQGR